MITINNSYQNQNLKRVLSNNNNSDGEVSELSPLSPSSLGGSSRRQLVLRRRRRSLVEKLSSGIQRAIEVFEFELNSNNYHSDDEDNDDGNGDGDSLDYSRSRISSADEEEQYNHWNKKNLQPPPRVIIRCLDIICFLVLIIGISFVFGFWFCRKAESNDPVTLLEHNSFIEDLENAAVATDHKVCSNVGNDILKNGGNAVDAGIATVFCLGVANPASSGLGGGGFILIHSNRKHHESRRRKFPSILDYNDARDQQQGEGSNNDNNNMMTEVIDCREVAPGAATQNMYLVNNTESSVSSIGGLSVAIPGELRGLELAHKRHGKLPWNQVVDPAKELARNGVPVSAHLAGDIQSMATEAYHHQSNNDKKFPKLRKIFTKNDNWQFPLREGDILRNEKLAETLHAIATNGSQVLYGGEGELTKVLVDEIRSEGGILTERDFMEYRPILRTPVTGEAFGHKFVGVPPPSSGGATIIGALRFLSGYQAPLASDKERLSVHRMAEAMRHAFAIRMSLSDPAFSNITATAVQDLVSGPYMEQLREITLDNSTLPLSMYGGEVWAKLKDMDGQKEAKDAHEGDRRRRRRRRLARSFGYLNDSGTSHLSIVDKDGNAIAISTSINQVFGSKVYSEKTGILLGDTMDDFGNPGKANFFGLEPSSENFVAPGKRPLSSMSPIMCFKKIHNGSSEEREKLVLVVGGSGGPKIISSVLQVIINYLLLGMALFQSIFRPRIHDQLIYHDSAVTTTEKSTVQKKKVTIEVPWMTKDALLQRGRDSLLDIDYAGTVQAVSIDLDTNYRSAASDVRKGGQPAGY